MTALSDLYQLITDDVDWADHIFIKAIDKGFDDPDKTIILVRDSAQVVGDFASNRFKSMQYTLQIQIFYSTSSDLDYDEVELELMEFLEDNNYTVETVRGRIQDPDTFQDFQTILVNKTKGV